MDSRFYSCRKCGTIVGLVEGSPTGLACDGEPLEMMRANSVDASREKHVPVVNVAESIVSVKTESDIDSFLDGFVGELFEERVAGLDDFELICFLVVK